MRRLITSYEHWKREKMFDMLAHWFHLGAELCYGAKDISIADETFYKDE